VNIELQKEMKKGCGRKEMAKIENASKTFLKCRCLIYRTTPTAELDGKSKRL
jgi:hypothetical protein